MGKLQSFAIVLPQPTANYLAGQTIQGNLQLVLNEPMKMREVRILFHGEANVHWTERHTRGTGKNRRTETVHYRSSEQYFSTRTTIYNPEQASGSDHHPAGTYTYPFSFQLPVNLPSSFEGQYGRVRYYVKGVVDRPWRFDHNCKQPFTVLACYDLNHLPQLLNPSETHNEKTLCCLCCTSGPIATTLKLGRQGYVPGENIIINGECVNRSRRDMDCSKIKLTQRIGFHARGKTKWETKLIAEIRRGTICPGDSEVYINEPLHIPPLPPSELAGCSIIDVKYAISLSIDPSGPSFDLVSSLDVVIGTIPFQNIQIAYSTTPFIPGNVPSVQPPPSDNAPPPPSYAECVFGKVDMHDDDDNEYTQGEMNWAPNYVYYSWSNPAQPVGDIAPPPYPVAPMGGATAQPYAAGEMQSYPPPAENPAYAPQVYSRQ